MLVGDERGAGRARGVPRSDAREPRRSAAGWRSRRTCCSRSSMPGCRATRRTRSCSRRGRRLGRGVRRSATSWRPIPGARADRRPGERAVRPGAGAAEPRRRVRPAREGRGPRGDERAPARLHGRGKVRDIYDVGEDHVLLVATDRISAFDVVLPNPIPDKGRVLTGLTLFWLERTTDVVPNHLVSADRRDFPEPFRERAVARRAGDARDEARRGDPRRVRGPRVPHGLGAQAVPAKATSAAWRCRPGWTSRRGSPSRSSRRRPRPPRATTCRSRSTRRWTWSAAGSPNACASSRSRCTSGEPRIAAERGSSWPTRSSSSGSPTAS